MRMHRIRTRTGRSIRAYKAPGQINILQHLHWQLQEGRGNSRAWIPRKASRRTRLLHELLQEIGGFPLSIYVIDFALGSVALIVGIIATVLAPQATLP